MPCAVSWMCGAGERLADRQNSQLVLWLGPSTTGRLLAARVCPGGVYSINESNQSVVCLKGVMTLAPAQELNCVVWREGTARDHRVDEEARLRDGERRGFGGAPPYLSELARNCAGVSNVPS
jgi:hypothetical protein